MLGSYKELVIFFTCLCLGGARVCAETADFPSQHAFMQQVKAGFVYNFTHYVDWPQAVIDQSSLFKVCTLKESALEGALQVLNGEVVGDQHVAVERVSVERAKQLRACQILFIDAQQESRLDALLARLNGAAVLTVADSPGFAVRGVMINLYVEGTKLRFELNSSHKCNFV